MERLRHESGVALPAAIFVIMIMIMLGLALASLADRQQGAAREERVREASFNLAEAALNAQIFQLTRRTWPTTSLSAPAPTCIPTSTADSCPDATALGTSFSASASPDYRACGSQAAWTTWVRDNPGTAQSYYSTAAVNGQPSWDQNGDGALWVGAEGASQCKGRTVVMLVRSALEEVEFRRNVVSANWFATTNNGKKVIVNTLGNHSAVAAPLQVRCVPPLPSGVTQPCLGYSPSKGQVSPPTASKSADLPSEMFTPAQLLNFQAQAAQLATYYPAGTCPPTLTGQVVFVEDLSGCPSYRGGNSPSSPGFLIIKKGTLSLTGNATFYGFIYAANLNPAPANGAVISLGGTSAIQGSVVVDGLGGVSAGSSSANIVFDPRAFVKVKTYGRPAPVSGTFRELKPGE